jgi:signal transduction histidine kinase/CheY-like chemotaxis protein
MDRRSSVKPPRKILLFCFILQFLGTGLGADTSGAAVGGVLDLGSYDFAASGIHPLKGEWEFYWGELLDPSAFSLPRNKEPEFRPVPGGWKTYGKDGVPLSLYGNATYRLRVLTNGKEKEFGLRLKRIYSAYRLYVNGSLITEAGSVHRNFEQTKAQLPIKTVFFNPGMGEIEIILQVSNPYYQRAGIMMTPEIGTQNQIARSQILALATDMFLLGVIFIMAAYYFIISLTLKDHRHSSLFFSIFCAVVGLRVALITGERFLYHAFPGMSLRVDMVLQSFAIYLLVPSFLVFLHFIFPKQSPKGLVRLIGFSSIAFLVFNLLAPVKLSGLVLTAYYPILIFGLGYMVVILVRAMADGEPYSYLEGFGFLFILATAVHDMLVDRELLHSDYILPLGLLCFIFVQSVILSGRFSAAFNRMQLLLEENRKIQGALESRVQERTADLLKVNESLTAARNQAEEANSAKSRFLANMSHEMRTPLNGVLGYAELIQETDPVRIHHTYAGKIIEESRNLLTLINHLLDLSKIEAGKLNLEIVPFDLTELLQSVKDILNPLAEKKSLTLRTLIQENVSRYLLGDPVRLRQILVNLGGNAIKFTESGWVEIRVEQQENAKDLAVVLFMIQDTGIGISREFQDIIFERFTQAQDGHARTHGGTGLGTTIAKQLVELMNGSIGLSSEKGRGSTFWVSIPFPLATADLVEAEPETPPNPGMPSLKDHTILLVEDYPTTQRITQHHLESSGAKVVLAENGIEAIKCLGKNKVDCILMDVQMPHMDGLEATRLIRRLPNTGGIPIIGMTASAFEADIRDCLDSGMNTVLTKPLRKRELIEKVAQILSARGGPSEYREIAPKGTSGTTPFRYEDFLTELDGDKETAGILLRGFLEQLDRQISLMERALEEKDFTTLHREAHALKGGSLNIFADPLAEAAADLERAARAETSEVSRIFRKLSGQVEIIRKAISVVLEEKD